MVGSREAQVCFEPFGNGLAVLVVVHRTCESLGAGATVYRICRVEVTWGVFTTTKGGRRGEGAPTEIMSAPVRIGRPGHLRSCEGKGMHMQSADAMHGPQM